MRPIAAAAALLTLAAALPAALPAQEAPAPLVLTIDDAIAMALGQNPMFLATQEKENEARSQVRMAVSRFLPTLNAQGTNTLDEKLFVLEFPSMIPGQPPQRISIDFTKNYQTALAFSLPLFAGGRLVAGYKQASYNLQASRESVRLSEQETVFNVKRAFYGLLLAQESLSVVNESLSLAESFRANVKNLYDVGMASKLDLLRSEVQVANLQPQAIRARNDVEVASLGLKTVLGLGGETPIEIKGQLEAPPLDEVSQAIVDEALAARPEIRQLEYQRRIAGEMLKIARGSRWPTIGIGGQYNLWSDSMSFRKGAWQNYYAINLSISLPIFNGFESNAQIGQAKAIMRELDWTHKGLSDAVAFEVRQAVLNRSQAHETLLSQEKNIEQAREAVRIAELNYNEGLATNLDVMTAQVALRLARTNYSQALYDCVISQAQLEKAVGRGRSSSGSNERRRP